MKLIYLAILLGALLQWLCGKHRGLAHGWPLADHRRPAQSALKGSPPLSSRNGPVSIENVSPPHTNIEIPPRQPGPGGPPKDTSGRDIISHNFKFLQTVSPEQQGAFLLSNHKMVPDRDGPVERDRQIPDAFFKEVQSEGFAGSENFERRDTTAEILGAPYFAVLPNPGQQPENMRDYALLDEADEPKTTPAMPSIIALPPIPLKENRITKIPIMTATIEDVIFPIVSTPKSTTAMGKRQQVTTPRPKTTKVRTKPPQKVASRTEQTLAQPTKKNGEATKSVGQKATKRPAARSQSATDMLKEHRGQKRSPQQELSYIPAFRRRQTVSNPFNNAPSRGFTNSGNAGLGNGPVAQNNPYRPLNNGPANDRNTFQNVPYDTQFSVGSYNPPLGVNNYNPQVSYGSNPLLGYGSPTFGFNDRVSGYSTPFTGYNSGFSIASPPFQNALLPYGGANQISAFIGGGFPNIALSYHIPTLSTPLFPSYLSGFATTGTIPQYPLQNQGILPAPYYPPVPALNPLFSSQGYPFDNVGFDIGHYDPREFLYRNDLRQRNNTESHRSAESYEIDNFNNFNRPPRRKNANPAQRPILDGFMNGMPGRTPIGQSISRLRPPANVLPPAPFYPAIVQNPSMPFGMPNHLTSTVPLKPTRNNDFSRRFPYNQAGQFDFPDFFNKDFDFPDHVKKPDFDDDDDDGYDEDDFVFQQEPKKTDFDDGFKKQPGKSISGSSTFKMQSDKTGSSQPAIGGEGHIIEDDAHQFPKVTSVDNTTETPKIESTDVQVNKSGATGTLGTLQQEIPQNNTTDDASATDVQTMGGNEMENGTTPQPQMVAQDRFSNDASPYETLYYRGNQHSQNPTLLAYFYPRRENPPNVASLSNLNNHGISINDPEIWKYFKVSEVTPVIENPTPKSKRTRKPQTSSAQECTDLFGNKGRCKTTKSKRKPKSKSKQKTEQALPYETLKGGLFLNFGEGLPQQYPDGTQLFYNSPHQYYDDPSMFNFNEPQQHNLNEPPQHNFKGKSPPNFNEPHSFPLEPYYPLPPPNTVPLSHIEHALLSQSTQEGWRPIAGPPRQARKMKPMYNRQHFRAQPPSISPHRHPAYQKGFRFPQ